MAYLGKTEPMAQRAFANDGYNLVPEGWADKGAGALYTQSTLNWILGENTSELHDLSGVTRDKFKELFRLAWKNNLLLYFSDGQRSFQTQAQLYQRYLADPLAQPQEAPAGFSYHNYGRAMRAEVLNYSGVGIMPGKVQEVADLAAEAGLHWKMGQGMDLNDFVNPDKTITELQAESPGYQVWIEDHPPSDFDENMAADMENILVPPESVADEAQAVQDQVNDIEEMKETSKRRRRLWIGLTVGVVLAFVGAFVFIKLRGKSA